jgi:hypothetical protein
VGDIDGCAPPAPAGDPANGGKPKEALQNPGAGKHSHGVRESRHLIPPEYDIKVQNPHFAVDRGCCYCDISVRRDGSTEKRPCPRRAPGGVIGREFWSRLPGLMDHPETGASSR